LTSAPSRRTVSPDDAGARGPSGKEGIMGDVGTKLVFENDRVKVWEFTLAPGQAVETHTHQHPYFFYAIEGSTLEVTRAGGRVDKVTLEAGQVYYREGGDTHGARNIGGTRYHEVLVELKTPPPSR
jgi:quercetin dioxygenase-like cupin family protein